MGLGHAMAKLERILIVGGGIAGLTVAVALRQRGFDPELVERETAWRAVGAGIAMQPNATRVLRTLGVGTAFERAGAKLRRFVFCSRVGETLSAIDLEELWGDVGPFIGVKRVKLQAALLSTVGGIRCRLGASVSSLKQADRRVTVGFNDSAAGEYDLVIGADGIASTVRLLAISAASPSYAGQMVWRGLAPIRPQGLAEVQFWLGDGCFFGLYPVGDRCTYFFGYVTEPRRHYDPPNGCLARLRDRFATFGAPVLEYLASLEDDEQIHCSAVEELHLPEWRCGRVLLIGDAAHASSPMMGQGGCMAIEDAFVLAELLSSSQNVEDALDAYVRRRRPRVDWVQRESGAVGQSVLLPPGIRDAALRERGAEMFRKRYHPLLAKP
jgi:2-polyprenyl-6-methoxyphenol hydroxylase-like FAD-dependent oxidoreductase